MSVVMPVFDRAIFARALRSALRQIPAPREVIVVDDGSLVALALPPDCGRARLIRLEVNRGAAAARNRGVAESIGRYVAFLDSDDLFLPGKLRRQLASAAAHEDGSETPILHAGGVLRARDGGLVRDLPIASRGLPDLASGCWYFPGSTGLVLRAHWDAVGPLDESLRRLEDLEWGLRLALAGGRVAVSDAPLSIVPSSGRGRRAPVEAASVAILAGTGMALPSPARRRLRAYLHLERAASAIGERAYPAAAAAMARSIIAAPRRTAQLDALRDVRPATPADMALVARVIADCEQDRSDPALWR